MQFVNNGFNLLKVNDSTHTNMLKGWFNSFTTLIIEEMSKKSLTYFNALCKYS
jgi:hypothetical protein